MASMEPYDYHTAPSSSSKGKQPAVARESPCAQSSSSSFPRATTKPRPRVSEHTFSRPQTAYMGSQTARDLAAADDGAEETDRRAYRSSTTWASSSGDMGAITGEDEDESHQVFVEEYNRLAKKYGVRPIVLGDFPLHSGSSTRPSTGRKDGGWIARVLHRNPSPEPVAAQPSHPQPRRTLSDKAMNLMLAQRRDALRNEDLQGLVRLCGKSKLYLPADYAPGSLLLPTCFRATAQCLVQNADTRGLFRLSGSFRVINALYDYYCADREDGEVATTTRCPNLPSHLQCGVHEVASTFKRLLSGLPGGILGSLTTFDALVAIHGQLHGEPEATRTKDSKLRARMIALAISTIQSRYQRDLVCAVFGLLCLVGRVAENAPREDDFGKPLPTSDLMGYNALSIVFGPLLVGELLNSYNMKITDPSGGLVLLPLSPSKHKKRKALKMSKESSNMTVDRVHVANEITEMLIVHWRDVVRQLKELNVMNLKKEVPRPGRKKTRGLLKASMTDTFSLRKPPDWSSGEPSQGLKGRTRSSVSASPTPPPRAAAAKPFSVKRKRPLPAALSTTYDLLREHPMNVLSPTVEEAPHEVENYDDGPREEKAVVFTPVSYEPRHQEGSSQTTGSSQKYHTGPERRRRDRPNTPQSAETPVLPRASSPSPRDTRDMVSVSVGDTNHLDPVEESHTHAPVFTPRLEDSGFSAPMHAPAASCEYPGMEDSADGYTLLDPDQRPASKSSTVRRYPMLNEECANDLSSSPDLAQHASAPGGSLETVDSPDSQKDEPREEVLPSSSGVGKFPSFHPSVIEAAKSLVSSRSSTSQHSHSTAKEASSLKSSPWSLKHLMGKRTPRTGKSSTDQGHDADTAAPTKPSHLMRWKELVKGSSDSSTTSLKEKRSEHNATSSRLNGEPAVEKNVTTPEWKQQLINKKMETQKKPPMLSPEKTRLFETLPSGESNSSTSPVKARGVSPTRMPPVSSNQATPQNTGAKPAGGAVKAMAALFDNASRDSPRDHRLSRTGPSRSNLRASASFKSTDTRGAPSGSPPKSPTKVLTKPPPRVLVKSPPKHLANSGPKSPAKSPTKSPTKSFKFMMTPSRNLDRRKSEDRAGPDQSPTRATKSPYARAKEALRPSTARATPKVESPTLASVALRPIRQRPATSHNEPRTEPISFPARESEPGRPPSLGQMIPHREEPPVAQHLQLARPPSATSSRSYLSTRVPGQDQSTNAEGDSPLLTRGSPSRSGSNNFLHTQVRFLQRQLDLKNEELIQLRTQLDTRANLDIGTLSEKLRESRRDCAMWRDRAEAAERRVAVFEKFTSKLRGIKTATAASNFGAQDGSVACADEARSRRGTFGSSSSCTEHTEDQEDFEIRIRQSLRQSKAATDGQRSPENDEAEKQTARLRRVRQMKERRDMAKKTSQLWMAAEELLTLQDNEEAGVA